MNKPAPTPQNPPLGRGAQIAYGLAAVILLGVVVVLPIWILILLGVVIYGRFVRHPPWWRRYVFVLFLLGLLGFGIAVVERKAMPLRSVHDPEFFWKYFPVSIFALQHFVQIHAAVVERSGFIRKPPPPVAWRTAPWKPSRTLDFWEIDPFSGEPYRELDGVLYSVGPDGKDDRLSIIYDPTNGTFTPGDIIVPEDRYRRIN